MSAEKKPIVVAVSGGFDPLHIGHVEMFRDAKKLGDRLVVIVNNDNWLKKKKGYAFMNEQHRKEIIESIRWVDEVIITGHPKDPQDMGVGKELELLRPDIFANGGDRKPDVVPIPGNEIEVCERIGCAIVYNIGQRGKIESSSELVRKAMADLDKRTNKS